VERGGGFEDVRKARGRGRGEVGGSEDGEKSSVGVNGMWVKGRRRGKGRVGERKEKRKKRNTRERHVMT